MDYEKGQTVIYKKTPYKILATGRNAYHLRGIHKDETIFSVQDTSLEPMLIYTRKKVKAGRVTIPASTTLKVKRLHIDCYLNDCAEIGAFCTWQGRQVYLTRNDFMTDEDLMKIA